MNQTPFYTQTSGCHVNCWVAISKTPRTAGFRDKICGPFQWHAGLRRDTPGSRLKKIDRPLQHFIGPLK